VIIELVPLEPEHVMKLLPFTDPMLRGQVAHAYFSPGSAARCLMADGEPVFAGGIVNLEWHRGEAWILPTPFFRRHVKTCFQIMRDMLPKIAADNGFVRVQAVAHQGVSCLLFKHLGFAFEGTLKHFGPLGETCWMYARFFGDGEAT
jgi:hypothetical protein